MSGRGERGEGERTVSVGGGGIVSMKLHGWYIESRIHVCTHLYVSSACLYHEETLQLMVNRWGKLEKDLKLKSGEFDISKIPDIYDCIKYDLLHNR